MKTAKLERKNMLSRRLRPKIDFQIFVFFAFQTEMDFGSLVCWATNSIGRQTQPCVFHLTPAGRPDPVTNCTVTKQSYSTMRVMCKPGFDGGLKQVRPKSNRKQCETNLCIAFLCLACAQYDHFWFSSYPRVTHSMWQRRGQQDKKKRSFLM